MFRPEVLQNLIWQELSESRHPLPKPRQGCASSNAELQPAGMHRRPGLLMAANAIFNVIVKLTRVLVINHLLATCLILSIGRPAGIEARPVDGETGAGGEIQLLSDMLNTLHVLKGTLEIFVLVISGYNVLQHLNKSNPNS